MGKQSQKFKSQNIQKLKLLIYQILFLLAKQKHLPILGSILVLLLSASELPVKTANESARAIIHASNIYFYQEHLSLDAEWGFFPSKIAHPLSSTTKF